MRRFAFPSRACPIQTRPSWTSEASELWTLRGGPDRHRNAPEHQRPERRRRSHFRQSIAEHGVVNTFSSSGVWGAMRREAAASPSVCPELRRWDVGPTRSSAHFTAGAPHRLHQSTRRCDSRITLSSMRPARSFKGLRQSPRFVYVSKVCGARESAATARTSELIGRGTPPAPATSAVRLGGTLLAHRGAMAAPQPGHTAERASGWALRRSGRSRASCSSGEGLSSRPPSSGLHPSRRHTPSGGDGGGKIAVTKAARRQATEAARRRHHSNLRETMRRRVKALPRQQQRRS